MNSEPTLKQPLLDAIRAEYGLKTDAQVARLLQMQTSAISKIRHGRPVSAETILIVQRSLGWSLRKIDYLLDPDHE